MRVPGAGASHQIITPTCRLNHGDMEALEEAFNRIRRHYQEILDRGEPSPDTEFHVALIVQCNRHREVKGG